MTLTKPAVSVVVPAYNAERWIEPTLATVRAQTFTDFEIIVVDDGSTDRTAEIVSRIAASEPRLRLVRQANGGVARARNTGIEHAQGQLVAPIDADDLWHPERLAVHVAALAEAGLQTGLAYSPFVSVDEAGNAELLARVCNISSPAFEQHLCYNSVGNGSGITARTSALKEVGGYSPKLRDGKVQGYEDWLLQLLVANRYDFVMAPLPYTGYRKSAGNMSGDTLTMRRSHAAMFDIVRAQCPERPRWQFWVPKAYAISQLFIFEIKARLWKDLAQDALAHIGSSLLVVPMLAIAFVAWFVGAAFRKSSGPSTEGSMPFGELDASAVRILPLPWSTRFWLGTYKALAKRRRR